MDCSNAINAICIAKTRHSGSNGRGKNGFGRCKLGGRILTMMLEDPIKGGQICVDKILQITIIHIQHAL